MVALGKIWFNINYWINQSLPWLFLLFSSLFNSGSFRLILPINHNLARHTKIYTFVYMLSLDLSLSFTAHFIMNRLVQILSIHFLIYFDRTLITWYLHCLYIDGVKIWIIVIFCAINWYSRCFYIPTLALFLRLWDLNCISISMLLFNLLYFIFRDIFSGYFTKGLTDSGLIPNLAL